MKLSLFIVIILVGYIYSLDIKLGAFSSSIHLLSDPSTEPTSEPTFAPTYAPSAIPSAVPSAAPTAAPSAEPTFAPSHAPSSMPTDSPTALPTDAPSALPSEAPSAMPSEAPSATPTSVPSAVPSDMPSAIPTEAPTHPPSPVPTETPSALPSEVPSAMPSEAPSAVPSSAPSGVPSDMPSAHPTESPTHLPSVEPTVAPSAMPSFMPSSFSPTSDPTTAPSAVPSELPSARPSEAPTSSPTAGPTESPSAMPTDAPSAAPSARPSEVPSAMPSEVPSAMPSSAPSAAPSDMPSAHPTESPTHLPSAEPTVAPSAMPSLMPSSLSPTSDPTTVPSALPSELPSARPSEAPTSSPTAGPTESPSAMPTDAPSAAPSARPSEVPSGQPTHMPSDFPSAIPSDAPSSSPSAVPTTEMPTAHPSEHPSAVPSESPSAGPTNVPSAIPSDYPTAIPTTGTPTHSPSATPTELPTAWPTSSPSNNPTASPSVPPTLSPTAMPTDSPTDMPTTVPTTSMPTARPSDVPSAWPTSAPTEAPTDSLTDSPSALPTNSPTNFPTADPSASPSNPPTAIPSHAPSAIPTDVPSAIPTTATPTADPSAAPTHMPSALPSDMPTAVPTTAFPTSMPSLSPTALPTEFPTVMDTEAPTGAPTAVPTAVPSHAPSAIPTDFPSSVPSALPSDMPTAIPTTPEPSAVPTTLPTAAPSPVPTAYPSSSPTHIPSALPSEMPSTLPTDVPSSVPSAVPTTATPTAMPSDTPSSAPSAVPTDSPTAVPTTAQPSTQPTAFPTSSPSAIPTNFPTAMPSDAPTVVPSSIPTSIPSANPTEAPTLFPTASPSSMPTLFPSAQPSLSPTSAPSSVPTFPPTENPTTYPSAYPTLSFYPTSVPSFLPTVYPSSVPSANPSAAPSTEPTVFPTLTFYPTSLPTTAFPTTYPSSAPTLSPTEMPSSLPTVAPSSGAPSNFPTPSPSDEATAAPTFAYDSSMPGNIYAISNCHADVPVVSSFPVNVCSTYYTYRAKLAINATANYFHLLGQFYFAANTHCSGAPLYVSQQGPTEIPYPDVNHTIGSNSYPRFCGGDIEDKKSISYIYAPGNATLDAVPAISNAPGLLVKYYTTSDSTCRDMNFQYFTFYPLNTCFYEPTRQAFLMLTSDSFNQGYVFPMAYSDSNCMNTLSSIYLSALGCRGSLEAEIVNYDMPTSAPTTAPTFSDAIGHIYTVENCGTEKEITSTLAVEVCFNFYDSDRGSSSHMYHTNVTGWGDLTIHRQDFISSDCTGNSITTFNIPISVNSDFEPGPLSLYPGTCSYGQVYHYYMRGSLNTDVVKTPSYVQYFYEDYFQCSGSVSSAIEFTAYPLNTCVESQQATGSLYIHKSTSYYSDVYTIYRAANVTCAEIACDDFTDCAEMPQLTVFSGSYCSLNSYSLHGLVSSRNIHSNLFFSNKFVNATDTVFPDLPGHVYGIENCDRVGSQSVTTQSVNVCWMTSANTSYIYRINSTLFENEELHIFRADYTNANCMGEPLAVSFDSGLLPSPSGVYPNEIDLTYRTTCYRSDIDPGFIDGGFSAADGTVYAFMNGGISTELASFDIQQGVVFAFHRDSECLGGETEMAFHPFNICVYMSTTQSFIMTMLNGTGVVVADFGDSYNCSIDPISVQSLQPATCLPVDGIEFNSLTIELVNVVPQIPGHVYQYENCNTPYEIITVQTTGVCQPFYGVLIDGELAWIRNDNMSQVAIDYNGVVATLSYLVHAVTSVETVDLRTLFFNSSDCSGMFFASDNSTGIEINSCGSTTCTYAGTYAKFVDDEFADFGMVNKPSVVSSVNLNCNPFHPLNYTSFPFEECFTHHSLSDSGMSFYFQQDEDKVFVYSSDMSCDALEMMGDYFPLLNNTGINATLNTCEDGGMVQIVTPDFSELLSVDYTAPGSVYAFEFCDSPREVISTVVVNTCFSIGSYSYKVEAARVSEMSNDFFLRQLTYLSAGCVGTSYVYYDVNLPTPFDVNNNSFVVPDADFIYKSTCDYGGLYYKFIPGAVDITGLVRSDGIALSMFSGVGNNNYYAQQNVNLESQQHNTVFRRSAASVAPQRRSLTDVTDTPSETPTAMPSDMPTSTPTLVSDMPTASPSLAPTLISDMPTASPSLAPTLISDMPTDSPTLAPTLVSDMPTDSPSLAPTLISDMPTDIPSFIPSLAPIATPMPTMNISMNISMMPTFAPTVFDSNMTDYPTAYPTLAFTNFPTTVPNHQHSIYPSIMYTQVPSIDANPNCNRRHLQSVFRFYPINRCFFMRDQGMLAYVSVVDDIASAYFAPVNVSSIGLLYSNQSFLEQTDATVCPGMVLNETHPLNVCSSDYDQYQGYIYSSAVFYSTRFTASPTSHPTAYPTATRTSSPTAVPTREPTARPTATPTTARPTLTPVPTRIPTNRPTESPTRVGAPTQHPTSVPDIVVAVSQTIQGCSFTDYLTNTTAYDLTIKYSIAMSIPGLAVSEIKDFVVAAGARRLLQSSDRRLTANSLQVSYHIQTQNPVLSFSRINEQLSAAASSGDFTAYMNTLATTFAAPSLATATAAVPTVVDSSPTASPTPAPVVTDDAAVVTSSSAGSTLIIAIVVPIGVAVLAGIIFLVLHNKTTTTRISVSG